VFLLFFLLVLLAPPFLAADFNHDKSLMPDGWDLNPRNRLTSVENRALLVMGSPALMARQHNAPHARWLRTSSLAGRHLLRTLIGLGCIVFSPNKMEPRNPEETPRAYSRFWYSFGLFLPFVDLKEEKVWKPKPDQTFLRNHMRLHILCGWILIPIVLAALTGLIK
jgi:hypothetical protein